MTHVLIVDDKPDNLYLLRALLTGHGCRVDEARHGGEALVKAHREPPDLVVSDLLMPVMDGYTLLRHWKVDDRLKDVPFVVYTATYTEPQDERLALDLGADAFIVKPAEPDAFMARIHEVLAQTRSGVLAAREPAPPPGETQLEQYSEILVRKLEAKRLELELTNRELAHDITARKLAEKRVRYLNRVHAVLSSIRQAIVREDDLQALQHDACRIAVEKGRFRLAWIGLIDADTGQLQIRAQGGADASTLDIVARLIQSEPPAGCAFTRQALGGHAGICNDIARDPRAVAWRGGRAGAGDRVDGGLPVDDRRRRDWCVQPVCSRARCL